MSEQNICSKHKQLISFVCTSQSCNNRRICEQCKNKQNLHFTQHANYIYNIKNFYQYTNSKDLIPRLEKGILDSQNFINNHKSFYNEQTRLLSSDFEQIMEMFIQISNNYSKIYIDAFQKEMNMFDEELMAIKALLKEYLYQKSQQESFFSRLFSNEEALKQNIDDLIKKNAKVFKVRAAIINLRSKIAMAKTNKTSYKSGGQQQAKFDQFKDFFKQFSINFYDKLKQLLKHEGSSNPLKSSIVSQSRSLSSSQVSQNLSNSQVSVDSISSNTQSQLLPNSSRSLLSQKHNQSYSQLQPNKTKVTLPQPHPSVMKIIKLLKAMQYPPNLSMLSNIIGKRDEGPFRYNLGTYYGTYEQGVRSGKGIFIFAKDGSFYQGTWQNDNMWGYGRLITQNSYYEGQIANGEAHGMGTYENSIKVYSGQWRNDLRHGKGEQVFKNKRYKYKGQFVSDKYHGYGVLQEEDFTYTGEFKEGFFDGDGTIRYKNGQNFAGKFKAGQRLQGKHNMLDGSYYQGQYDLGVPNGRGEFRWGDGVRYIGNWRNGAQQGQGIQILQNGREKRGLWKDGLWIRWI